MHTKELAPIETSTFSEKAYELLKEQIIQRKVLPGEKLDINALSRILGISRTPIKEAFNRLSMEGLITIFPHRGTFVRAPLDPKEVGELFAVRLMIELWGAEAAIKSPSCLNLGKMAEILQRGDRLFSSDDTFGYMAYFQLDHEFHSVIVAAAANARLSEMYESLAVHIQILRTYWGQPRDRALKSHEHHYQIFEAFRNGSPDTLDILRGHIQNSKTLTLALGAEESMGEEKPPSGSSRSLRNTL